MDLFLLKSYFTLQVMYSFPMLTSHGLSCLPFKLFEGEHFLNLASTRTNLHWWWPCRRCIISNYQLWEVRMRSGRLYVNKQLILELVIESVGWKGFSFHSFSIFDDFCKQTADYHLFFLKILQCKKKLRSYKALFQ